MCAVSCLDVTPLIHQRRCDLMRWSLEFSFLVEDAEGQISCRPLRFSRNSRPKRRRLCTAPKVFDFASMTQGTDSVACNIP